jgi:hypothetical protein
VVVVVVAVEGVSMVAAVEGASMVVVAASTAAVLAVEVSTAAALVLVVFITLEVESAAAAVESALAECAAEVVLQLLKAQDPAFLRLDIHRRQSAKSVALANKVRARMSQGSWLSAFPTLANTSPHSMMRIGTTIGTGGMFISTMAASLYSPVGFGAG